MEKKFYLFIYLLILSPIIVSAQNLITNYSFEDHVNIPCAWTTLPQEFSEFVNDWYIPNTTSTDIHSTDATQECWSNPTSSVTDDCRMGTQSPRTGKTMAGLYTLVSSHTWHEYMQIKLAKPLEPGKRYCVQMYVSAADNASFGTNNIGMLFTKGAVKGNELIMAEPQINYTEVITDTENWTLIAGSFIAEESAEYLTVGNFFPDDQTIKAPITDNHCTNGAYYFIDDVVVLVCPI